MRQRNWTFYKVVLYLGIAVIAGLLSLLLYIALKRYGSYTYRLTIWLMLLGACLQVLFCVMCIRFIHHYLPNKLHPGKFFRILYTVLLVFNSCAGIASLWLFAYGFSETFLNSKNRPDTISYFAVSIVGSYTFITLYLSAATIVIRRYQRYQVALQEEEWLRQLGSHSLNP